MRRVENQTFEDPYSPLAEGQSEINLVEYLQMLRRHWKLIAVACLLGLAVSAVLYSTTPKRYMAATVIQIERRSLVPLSGNQSSWWLENWWNAEYYPTQYELLKSRGLAEKVVQDLRLAEHPVFNPERAHLGSNVVSSAVTAADDRAALGRLAQGLIGEVSVAPVRGTQLVRISYRSSDPELAADVANGFAEAFILWGIEDRELSADRATTFLAQQIDTVKEEIQELEEEFQAFSRRPDVMALDPESNTTLQRLKAVNQEYIDVRSERIQKEAQYNELLSLPKETVAETLSGGLVGQLRSDQLRLEREYATKLNIYKPEWPAMAELKSRIDKGRQHLANVVDEMAGDARESARAEFQTTLRREQALKQEYESLKEERLALNSAAVDYNNLQVEISTRRQLLDELMRRQSETGVASESVKQSNVRIVDRALVPRSPYRPQLRQDLMKGLAVGLLLGIGLALLIEFLDRSVKTGDELERLVGLPTLAVVPDISANAGRYGYRSRSSYGYGQQRSPKRTAKRRRGRKQPDRDTSAVELIPQTRPRLAISEAYRSLRTALLLSSAEELRVVAISSGTASEGKTATSANLGTVMAQLGRRVLIIDGDLRKPRLHELFRISNRIGLVNFLVGRAEPEAIVFSTSVPNLALMPSGPIPPNPSELLASERMRDLLRWARGAFDFVLLDTPPALAVTDATLLGVLADGLVLCFQAGRARREDIKACRERLLLAGVKLLGGVLNRYQDLGGRYGKYYYHHYEAYGEQTMESRADSAA